MPPNPRRKRRSRALWDAARAPGASRLDLARAILYEIQPVRFDEIDYVAAASRSRTAASGLLAYLRRTVPSAAIGTIVFLCGRSRREWFVAASVVAYYGVVRYVHRVLDAGPMVVILSALIAILTIGLGDDEGSGRGGVSAYSVFNRGFQRLLGSVDVEALVAQHVGGGFAVQGLAAQMREDDAERHVERRGAPVAARGGDGDGVVGEAAAAAADDDDAADGRGQQQRQHGQQNRARRSGKKARRRNLEIRREMQRQRQAAAAMGFAGDGGEAEIAAMNRLIEDQAIAAGAFEGEDTGDEDLE